MVGVLVEQHLEEIGLRMGRLLRGFDDLAIHVGAPSQFAREFRKVLALPLLRQTGGDPLSYADAVREARVAGIHPQAADAVNVLLQGLRGPATQSADPRVELQAAEVTADLDRLLHEPVLRLYLQSTDRTRLLSAARALADRDGRALAVVEHDAAPPCPRCGARLLKLEAARPLVCERCDKPVETIEVLPMSEAVAGVLSFDFLRELVALRDVTTYQESGDIRPVDAIVGE